MLEGLMYIKEAENPLEMYTKCQARIGTIHVISILCKHFVGKGRESSCGKALKEYEACLSVRIVRPVCLQYKEKEEKEGKE